MKTVVTGGNGFIGSHLVKKLLENGGDVIVASDFKRLGTENLRELGVKESDIEVRDTDLTLYGQALPAIAGADTVFHLAARVGSLEYLHGTQTAELEALQSNLAIDANIFRACAAKGVKRIVYASSCAVYPMDNQFVAGTSFREAQIQFTPAFTPETKPGIINPDGGYGWSKLMGELQLNWTRRMKIGIARIFNIYGVNEPLEAGKSHVVADLIKRVIQHPQNNLQVYGDGKQTRDVLYVTDCADALVKLEGKVSNPPVTVNIGGGVPVSVATLAQTIVKVSGKNVDIAYDVSKPVGPVSRTAVLKQSKAILGWQPKVSLDEGIERTYLWIKKKVAER